MNQQKGVSLYLAIVIMVILLAIVLSITTILVGQLKMIREMENSVIAFYAADTGIEEVLKVIIHDAGTPAGEYNDFLDLNDNGIGSVTDCPANLEEYDDACYKVLSRSKGESFPDGSVCGADNYCLRSRGVYKETRRSIEIEI